MIMKIYILLGFFLHSNLNVFAEKKSFTIEFEFNGTKYERDLIEFIQENKKKLNSNIREKSVMVLGLTGTGKSTLINFLNNIPLVCVKENNKWVLKLENENLSDRFSIAKIGHEVSSQTFMPAAYNPQNKDYSFIDNPGFKDTHGLSTAITNGFFRSQITTNVKDIKFLLLLTYSDLIENKGQQFRESIKAFSYLIGAFDEENVTRNLSESIGIIITKVNNDGETDEAMKQSLQIALKKVLQDEAKNKKLSKKEQNVFSSIIDEFQIEIFSNPYKKGPVSNYQSLAIQNLIDLKLHYARKIDLKIRAKISDNYKSQLLNYIHQNYMQFGEDFSELFNMAISRYHKRTMISNIENGKNLYVELHELIKNGTQENNFDLYVNNLSSYILNDEEKEEILSQKYMFNYFIQLFSDEEKKIFPLKKKWISDKNKSKLDYLINDLEQFFLEKFNEFQVSIEDLIENGIERYVKKKINDAIHINDIKQLEQTLDSVKNSIIEDNNLELFLKNLNDFVDRNEYELILNKERVIKDFINVLPNDKKNGYPINKRKWIGIEFISNFDNLIKDLKTNYQNENESSFKNGIYTYKGYFANVNFILELINNRDDIDNLKSVEIFAINSVKFDNTFIIKKERYRGKSPDLIIISPQVLITRNTHVNLSSAYVPGYPYEGVKARNANVDGGSGEDGKPGLPGYSGGNLLIITNDRISSDLIFKSKGGMGGRGQNG